jgi:hypothetical protein
MRYSDGWQYSDQIQPYKKLVFSRTLSRRAFLCYACTDVQCYLPTPTHGDAMTRSRRWLFLVRRGRCWPYKLITSEGLRVHSYTCTVNNCTKQPKHVRYSMMKDCGYYFRLHLSALEHRTDSIKESSRGICKTLLEDFTVTTAYMFFF